MEVNKHINFLKRRGFLIKESSQTELSFDEPTEQGLDFEVLCSEGSGIFCELNKLINTVGVKDDERLKVSLIQSITKIFTYLKPPIKDNRSKFTRLIQVILRQNLENSINTFEMIADSIDGVNVSELRKKIDSLTDEQIKSNDGWLLNIINDVKHRSYTEYENSFIGSHFVSAKKSLLLSIKGETVLNKSFTNLLVDYLSGGGDYRELVTIIYDAIKYNALNGEGRYIKADLMCVETLTDGEKDIIEKDHFVEVKKLDYKGDSYLSEFFAIYKNDVPEILKTPRALKFYNQVVDSLYLKMSVDDGGVIEMVRGNFDGIIYSENRFIPKGDIELYWSNKGQRVEDHRLTIRYRLKSSSFHSYIYDKTADILRPEFIEMGVNPVDVNLDITEGLLKEDGFDWVTQHIESIPNEPEIIALLQHLSHSEVLGEDFREDKHSWYGEHTTYTLQNGEEWVVGTEETMDKALHEYWAELIDSVGFSEDGLGLDLSNFILISQDWIRSFATDEANQYVEDLSDEECLDQSDDTDKHETLVERYDELGVKFGDLENELQMLNNLHPENQVVIEEKMDEMDELTETQNDVKREIESLIQQSRKIVWDEYYQMNVDGMQDPVGFLVDERGWFLNGSEMVTSMGLDIDIEAVIEYYSQDGYGSMSSYDGLAHDEYVGDDWYILIRIN